MAKRRIANPWHRKKEDVYTLDKIKEGVPWYFSGLTWDQYKLCIAWIVLKYVLYDGEEWSILSSERDMKMQYGLYMSRATKSDKKFIGVMANQILELGGYYERED
jgi:hypothetical protein